MWIVRMFQSMWGTGRKHCTATHKEDSKRLRFDVLSETLPTFMLSGKNIAFQPWSWSVTRRVASVCVLHNAMHGCNHQAKISLLSFGGGESAQSKLLHNSFANEEKKE